MTTAATPCPLCLPRPDDSPYWIKVCTLSVSTLYLDRNQTYRGHCQLVYDQHVVGLENLTAPEMTRLMTDLHRAAQAIRDVCHPDLMNYASMGNVVPHLHWHLVPRYTTDPRWGMPIYLSNLADMRVTHLSEADCRSLVNDLRLRLELREGKASS
jgi:diadenosine tetraphosphate (Ap4A) HIT family hydrolase